VSYQASNAVIAAREAGLIPGGPRLAVALVVANRANHGTGRLLASTRGLADVCAVSKDTVTAALSDLSSVLGLERLRRGNGSLPSVYRFPTVPANGTDAEVTDTFSDSVDNLLTVPANGTADRPTSERDRPTYVPANRTVGPATVRPRGTEQGSLSNRADRRGFTDPEDVPGEVSVIRRRLTMGAVPDPEGDQ
jgi:hypothetical protein